MDIEYIYVDSRTRDTSLYPNGNAYSVFLTNPMKNIQKVDLVSATIPNTIYNFSGGNFLQVNSTNIPLYASYYTSSTVVSELSALTVFSGTGVSVVYNPSDQKFIFYSSTYFTLTPSTTQSAQILGLPSTTTNAILASTDPVYQYNTTYSSKYIIKSPNIVDFSSSEIIFLDIEEFRTQRMNLGNKLTGYLSNVNSTLSNVFMPVNTSAAHAIAVVPMDVAVGAIKAFKEHTDYSMGVVFPHVVEKVSKLTINWRDINGNLVNFNGSNNNSFVLRVQRSDIPPIIPRQASLPDPVAMPGKPTFNTVVMVVLAIGLLTIILMKKQ